MNQEQKQTDITTGKQIRHLRTQSGMTQEELTDRRLSVAACVLEKIIAAPNDQ